MSHDEEYVKSLIRRFKDEPNFISEQIVAELYEIGEAAVLPLIDALKDEDSGVRYYSTLALEFINDPRAIKPLYPLLKDDDGELRYEVALALPRFGIEDTSFFLAALNDNDWRMRSSAAIVLGENSTQEALEPISKLLKDEIEDVRWSAVEALGRLGSKEAVPFVIEVASDKSKRVRWRVAAVLGKLADEQALPTLDYLCLNDPDPSVREIATEAVKKLRP